MKILTMLFAVGLLGLTACDEGPAEEFGRKVDEASSDTRDAIKDAGEEIKEAGEEIRDGN